MDVESRTHLIKMFGHFWVMVNAMNQKLLAQSVLLLERDLITSTSSSIATYNALMDQFVEMEKSSRSWNLFSAVQVGMSSKLSGVVSGMNYLQMIAMVR